MGGRGGKKINMELKLSKTYLLFSGFITVKRVRVIRLRFFNANRYFYIPISKLGLDSNVKMSDYSTEELLNGLRDKVLKYTNDRDIKAYETRMSVEMAQNDAKRLAFEEKRSNKKAKNTPK